MALASTTLSSNFRLGFPVQFDPFNNFSPIHNRLYRISGKNCQRLSNKDLHHNCDMENTFGGRVRESRKALKWSQVKLAERSGVSQTTISDIERGRNDGSKEIVQIAKALQKTPEFLLTGKSPTEDRSHAVDIEDWKTLPPKARALIEDIIANTIGAKLLEGDIRTLQSLADNLSTKNKKSVSDVKQTEEMPKPLGGRSFFNKHEISNELNERRLSAARERRQLAQKMEIERRIKNRREDE